MRNITPEQLILVIIFLLMMCINIWVINILCNIR
jgi:hypothetical protein